MQILNNKLGVSFLSDQKCLRRTKELTDKEIKERVIDLKKVTKLKSARATLHLEEIVMGCSLFDLNEQDYPFIDQPSKIPAKKNNYGLKTNLFGGEEEEDELPYLIVFVVGGISHNEICALENLNIQKKVRHKLVIGSTSIITAKDYLNQLSKLKSQSDSNPVNEVDLKSIELKFI